MTLTERERTRLTALTLIEQPLWAQGLRVGGMDEVGRGPLAGPVCAAAVILPRSAAMSSAFPFIVSIVSPVV